MVGMRSFVVHSQGSLRAAIDRLPWGSLRARLMIDGQRSNVPSQLGDVTFQTEREVVVEPTAACRGTGPSQHGREAAVGHPRDVLLSGGR